MPVPASINDLSTTAASNYPQGSEAALPLMDDYMRAIQSFVAFLRDNKLNTSAVSSFIMTLLDDADAATARGTLGALAKAGDTMTGPLVLSGDASAALNPVTKQQFDAKTTLASGAEATSGTDATKLLTPSTLRSGLNAIGSAPVFALRAWANFDGTLTGTNAARAGGNVASITRNAPGNYTMTFVSPMPGTGYALLCTSGGLVVDDIPGGALTTSVSFRTFNLAGVATDYQRVSVAVVN